MNRKDAIKRINTLKQELKKHNKAYYLFDEPEISDAQYDRLMRELQDLEIMYPDLATADSPSKTVGAEPSKRFSEVRHSHPMLSLDNALSLNELDEFDQRVRRQLKTEQEIEYIVEPKLDGLAVELVYQNGVFFQGSTRGDGFIGENITGNLKTIRNLPIKLSNSELSYPDHVEIRGEVFLFIEEFRRINELRLNRGERLFANPRNAAAGSLRQLNPNVTRERNLSLYCYGISDGGITAFETHADVLQAIEKWGLPVNPWQKVCRGFGDLKEQFALMESERKNMSYEIDGMVVKVNHLKYWKELGYTTRSPRYAIACKFSPVQETTRLIDIKVQVGRMGTLTPVAILEPVLIGGVKVSKATLHNEAEINKKNIKIGDTVVVQRAGDVIPEIVMPVASKRTGEEKLFKMPVECPVCGTAVLKTDSGVVTQCPNPGCEAQVIARVKHFASRSAMDIEGLGTVLISKLVKKGWINDIADVYSLSVQKLAELERMGSKSAGNLVANINKSKKIPLKRFILALGIPLVGNHLAGVLAKTFKTLNAFKNATIDELTAIHGIGTEVADAVYRYVNDENSIRLMERLSNAGVEAFFEDPDVENAEGPFSGETVLFTGKLKGLTRNEAQQLAIEHGGKTASSFNKNVTMLVCGEDPGSKLLKAQRQGIAVIDETEFLQKTGHMGNTSV